MAMARLGSAVMSSLELAMCAAVAFASMAQGGPMPKDEDLEVAFELGKQGVVLTRLTNTPGR
jgi:hypothetical protein